jgi:hypothetical protein
MKSSPWMVRLALALLLVLAMMPLTRVGAAHADDGSGDQIDRWWGAAGAVLCGAEIRLATTAPVIGMNPYVMAAGIGGCLLAVLDIATT